MALSRLSGYGARVLKGAQGGNPALEWCIGNVVGKPDCRGNLYPTKARSEQKIDAAVALIMAIGRSMTKPEQFTSIFERAELWSA